MHLLRSHRAEPAVSAQSSETAAKSRPSTALLVVAMASLQVVASLCYPIAKYGLEYIEPFTFAFYRFIMSSAALLLMVMFTRRDPPVERSDWKHIALLGFLIIPFNQTLFLVGQRLTGANHGAVLFATTPVFIFVLAVLHLKEKAGWRRTLGVIMATGGVMTIMLAGAINISTDYLFGDLILIVSVVAWAWYTVLGKRLVEKYGALRTTAYALSIGSLLYLPLGFYFALQYDYSQATPAAWGTVVYMALGLSVFVYVLWYWLLKHLDASRIAVYHNVQPIIASSVAFLFLGEPVTASFIVGASVVLAGVVITEV